MAKKIILSLGGLVLVLLFFFFGRTVPNRTSTDVPVTASVRSFNITQFIDEKKKTITASQAITLSKLENSVIRGDVAAQQAIANSRLAEFWKDSIPSFEAYIYYLSEAAKLDKSEKNLTFAAQLILDNLRGEQDEAKLNWKAEQAIALFEMAIVLNPDNDDLKVGLGSCYVFGRGRLGNPEETMKGIQQLLAVVKKDSTNMIAQMMLGVGGYVSGQYDKAIERLQKVVTAQPNNLEAIAFLADTYAAKGDKTEAVKWYLISKRLANDPHYSQEVDERIRSLR